MFDNTRNPKLIPLSVQKTWDALVPNHFIVLVDSTTPTIETPEGCFFLKHFKDAHKIYCIFSGADQLFEIQV